MLAIGQNITQYLYIKDINVSRKHCISCLKSRVLWIEWVYHVVCLFKRENYSCSYWWWHCRLLMAARKFVRLQVSCDPPSSKHNFTGQSTSVQVRLCEKEAAASSRLAAHVIYENILFMQRFAFPVPLFCTLQIPSQPGISVLFYCCFVVDWLVFLSFFVVFFLCFV